MSPSLFEAERVRLKVGYELVGAEREWELRDGQRSGIVTMTITRDTWDNILGDTLLPYIQHMTLPAETGP